jgi:hypothetical protein
MCEVALKVTQPRFRTSVYFEASFQKDAARYPKGIIPKASWVHRITLISEAYYKGTNK